MENLPQKPIVIFDIGGVLIEWNPRHLYRKIFNDEAEMERFLADVCTHDWNAQQDAGRPFREACDELIPLHPQYADQISAFFDRWPEMMNGTIEGSVEILQELKDVGAPLYAITNWSGETFPHAQSQFPFLEIFEDMVVSAHVKLIKPHREIFDHAIEKFGIDPRHAVFIDDVEKNVEGARSAGLHGHHFQGAQGLREMLRGVGWLP